MSGNLHIQVPGCTTCPVLSCCCCCFVVFAAALVRPSCSPYPPADEPEPFTVIPDGESGKQLHYTHIHTGIEKNEMGGACGAYGGGERCAQGSGGET